MSADDLRWCPRCGVTMEFHDLTDVDPCEQAEAQAERLERMERLMFGGYTR